MKFYMFIASALSLFSLHASADVDTAKKLVDKYSSIAKTETPGFTSASAQEGEAFFTREVIQFKGDKNKSGKAIACASCHTSNPADIGKHIVTGKLIKPLSPAVNSKRFNSITEVEKQFSKHCNEVVGSDCTSQEKANYIAFLLTKDKPSK